MTATIHDPSRLEVFVTVAAGTLIPGIYKDYVNTLGLQGTERVLDFGTGSGNPAIHLAAALPRGGLTCVDISQGWMDVARRRLRRFDNVDFKVGPIQTLDIPPASHDIVFIHFVLHDIDAAEREPIMRALAGILVPGGRVFIREPLRFISQAQVQAVMQAAGLTPVSETSGEVPTQGPVYAGVFQKPRPV